MTKHLLNKILSQKVHRFIVLNFQPIKNLLGI